MKKYRFLSLAFLVLFVFFPLSVDASKGSDMGLLINNKIAEEFIIPVENLTGDIISDTIPMTYEKYKVTFDANGGFFSDNKEIFIIDEWEIGDENNFEKPSRKDYRFIGFFTKKEGGTSLESYIAEAGIDDNLTFYAQWELNEETPQTPNTILKSILIATVSLGALVGILIYFYRKNKVQTN